jgi:hypothetical protein
MEGDRYDLYAWRVAESFPIDAVREVVGMGMTEGAKWAGAFTALLRQFEAFVAECDRLAPLFEALHRREHGDGGQDRVNEAIARCERLRRTHHDLRLYEPTICACCPRCVVAATGRKECEWEGFQVQLTDACWWQKIALLVWARRDDDAATLLAGLLAGNGREAMESFAPLG